MVVDYPDNDAEEQRCVTVYVTALMSFGSALMHCYS